MRILRYGFFGEDDAQRLFLRHYLTKLATGRDWRFEEDTNFLLAGGNKSRVKALFDEACELGLSQYQHDCFFIGLDLDDHNDEVFHETVREMQKRLSDRKLSAILLIPVQCIEHWLRYLQWHTENPQSTKNITLETEERKQAKTNLYGSPKTSTRHSNPIVERIAANMDITWLESRSTSFLAFHRQAESYLLNKGLA
jgi:hypothetical protein